METLESIARTACDEECVQALIIALLFNGLCFYVNKNKLKAKTNAIDRDINDLLDGIHSLISLPR